MHDQITRDFASFIHFTWAIASCWKFRCQQVNKSSRSTHHTAGTWWPTLLSVRRACLTTEFNNLSGKAQAKLMYTVSIIHQAAASEQHWLVCRHFKYQTTALRKQPVGTVPSGLYLEPINYWCNPKNASPGTIQSKANRGSNGGDRRITGRTFCISFIVAPPMQTGLSAEITT